MRQRAAGGEQAQARATSLQCLGQCGAGGEQVLAVVEQQQAVPLAQVGHNGDRERRAEHLAQAEQGG